MPYKDLVLSLPSRASQYIGLDLVNNPIHRNMPDITWENGKIPLEDGFVDCALCTEVLEHCLDPEDVLNEIFRVLKPGGLFFFTVPFFWPAKVESAVAPWMPARAGITEMARCFKLVMPAKAGILIMLASSF